ncbi:hypothetical protein [Streptomyces cadmiisoli]
MAAMGAAFGGGFAPGVADCWFVVLGVSGTVFVPLQLIATSGVAIVALR